MNKIIWISWAAVSIALGAYFIFKMFYSEDKSDFLIGEASHGHFQIELACESCHTSAFGGGEVLQDACVSCHAEELEEAHDSHPKKKFTDPREAYRIKILDARYCVSCHTEHQNEQTRVMGVTLPDDYCYHCHKEVGEERESHKDLPFDSCASAGCHNYHDNRALYESFLVENSNEPWLKAIATIAPRNSAKLDSRPKITLDQSQFQEKIAAHRDISNHWQASSHADAGVDCGGCHQENKTQQWIEKPSINECKSCHEQEALTYTQGKHGMRLANNLSSSLDGMKPKGSKLPFHHSSLDLVHSCDSYHKSHDFNTKDAAVEACLGCHNDEHSTSFKNSKHFSAWINELNGMTQENTGVSCATCHMPRISEKSGDKTITRVQHNQNWNLRPNEKMIRSVCMDCHSLEFSIDALADEELIKNNFSTKPGTHIESIDWALKRAKTE